MSIITFEHLQQAAELLDELTPDMEVVRAGADLTKVKDPFACHTFCSFIISDGHEDPDVFREFLSPLMQAMAQSIQSIKKLEVQPLDLPTASLGVLAFSVPNARVPLRLMASYSAVEQGIIVAVDFIGRHVGNYHRTIINGPLHRHQMPFREDPKDGHEFDYLYLPMPEDRKSYGDWVERDDSYDSDEFIRLPALEQCVEDDSMHRYRVRGEYCYYMGETLTRELKR
ncbi:MAG: hypothetical protein ACYS7Y_25080 [Planctomycetota bacterium]|jgi:hypothetical protein